MLSGKPASTRYLLALIFMAALFGLLVIAPAPRNVGAKSSELVVAEPKSDWMEPQTALGSTPGVINWKTLEQTPLGSTNTVCLQGGFLAGTPTFNRPQAQTSGTGITPPCAGSINGTATRYKTYQFNLTGCTTFPARVTVSGCPGGTVGTFGACTGPAAPAVDTIMYIYRTGGSLTAGTGTTGAFVPANTCLNVQAANDDLAAGTATNAGGSACDNIVTSICHPVCGTANQSGMIRSLGQGFFSVVVVGFSNTSVGNYNLYVNAPDAGCQLANTPTAADGNISGSIIDNQGNPIAGTVVSLSGTQSRKTITDSNGNYQFTEVEAGGFYTVTPSRANFSFSPAERSFNQLQNNTEAAFSAVPINAGANPLDTPEYFVRQHYLDFLGREPEESGFNFWSDQILECGSDEGCLDRRRINVSAAYFLSIEFQETGGFVDGLYRASYGRRPMYAEFMPDAGIVREGIVVGAANWAQDLATNKQEFLASWIERPAFRAAYDALADEAFVDTLISHTGVSFDSAERAALVSGLANGTLTRAAALQRIAENQQFVNVKRNEAFVMMEYFGYLRRDPDESGYQFWLNKLNQFGGNFEQAEMVKAFIVSGEYRDRFPN